MVAQPNPEAVRFEARYHLDFIAPHCPKPCRMLSTLQGWLRQHRVSQWLSTRSAWLPPLMLVALIITWISLALTVFYIGPTEWDGHKYSYFAKYPASVTQLQNRYVHLWGLRIAYEMFDNSRLATAVYAGLITGGTMIGAFALGRKAAGPGTGVLTAAMVPMTVGLLSQPNSSLADPASTCYACAAVAAAACAPDFRSARRRWVGFCLSGLFCFLAVKSKETGVASIPAVLTLAWSDRRQSRALIAVAAGAVVGWFLLMLGDALLLGDLVHSVRPNSYKPPRLGSVGRLALPSREIDYFTHLTSGTGLVLTIGGTGGFFLLGKRSRVVRAVALWALGALTFMSIISWIYGGVQPQARYLIPVEVALVIGVAGLLSEGWNEHRTTDVPGINVGNVVQAGAVLFPPAFLFFLHDWITSSSSADARITALLLRVACLSLLGGAVIASATWVRRLSVIAFVCCFAFSSHAEASKQHGFAVAKVAPFDAILSDYERSREEQGRLSIALLDTRRPLSRARVQRRLMARSETPIPLMVSEERTLARAARYNYVFTSDKHSEELKRRGFQRFATGTRSGRPAKKKGDSFVVYRRKHVRFQAKLPAPQRRGDDSAATEIADDGE